MVSLGIEASSTNPTPAWTGIDWSDVGVSFAKTPDEALRWAMSLQLDAATRVLVCTSKSASAILGALRNEKTLRVLVLVNAAAEAAEVLQLGAYGVLREDALPLQIRAAVDALRLGLTVVDATLGPVALGPASRLSSRDLTDAPSARESEVLRLLAEGLSNKEIAEKMAIQASTVKFHLDALRRKCRATTRTDIVVRAARRGWLTL
ncbi:MAG: response regulator transcription factor [Deltaproteobacteria bacterium]|nr:response regulator transcription factor [Deltaproteobacteria bacterium]